MALVRGLGVGEVQADVPQIGVTASRCCCTHVGLVKLYDITVAVPGSVFPVPQGSSFNWGYVNMVWIWHVAVLDSQLIRPDSLL